MEYLVSPYKPVPSIPNKLMELANVSVLGTLKVDGIEFFVLKTKIGVIALDCASGFYYPFRARWKLFERVRKNLKYLSDGEDMGELIKCSFILGRDEGQKRLRTVLDVPTDYKVILLSGGGIRIKDSSGIMIPTFSLLEGMMTCISSDQIAIGANQFDIIQAVVRDSEHDRECHLAYDFMEEQKDCSGLFSTISQCSDSDDEGSVISMREEFNSKTYEAEMHHQPELENQHDVNQIPMP